MSKRKNVNKSIVNNHIFSKINKVMNFVRNIRRVVGYEKRF